MKDEKSFPIVGIGASAGGLAAFEAFFAGMPAQLIKYVSHDKSLLSFRG